MRRDLKVLSSDLASLGVLISGLMFLVLILYIYARHMLEVR